MQKDGLPPVVWLHWVRPGHFGKTFQGVGTYNMLGLFIVRHDNSLFVVVVK